MYVKFEAMDPSARVWVYQADRRLTDEEVKIVNTKTMQFCEQWAAHGAPLHSSFTIHLNQFVVLAVDESKNMATGCSIDSSVELMRQLEGHLNVSFFDRTKIAFLIEDDVYLLPMSNIKDKIAEGTISPNTLTFNNLVKDVGELKQNWKVTAGSSWLKRYFV